MLTTTDQEWLGALGLAGVSDTEPSGLDMPWDESPEAKAASLKGARKWHEQRRALQKLEHHRQQFGEAHYSDVMQIVAARSRDDTLTSLARLQASILGMMRDEERDKAVSKIRKTLGF